MCGCPSIKNNNMKIKEGNVSENNIADKGRKLV